MGTEDLDAIERSIKHWYLPLLMGIIFIIVGIWVFMTPVTSYLALAFLFGFTFLLTGAIEVIAAIVNRGQLQGWGWQLTIGIVDLLIGILLVTRMDLTLIVLPLFVGFAVMFRAISSIGWSIDLRRFDVPDWWRLLIVGILGLILAFILLSNPTIAGLTVVVYTAMAFILIGFFQIYLSLGLRKLKKLRAD